MPSYYQKQVSFLKQLNRCKVYLKSILLLQTFKAKEFNRSCLWGMGVGGIKQVRLSFLYLVHFYIFVLVTIKYITFVIRLIWKLKNFLTKGI